MKNKTLVAMDTPYHIGFVKKDEDDPRRHKSRCIHYEHGTKNCLKNTMRCVGSAHCTFYQETYSKEADPEYNQLPSYYRKFINTMNEEKQQNESD